MTVTVRLPGQLRDYAGGAPSVEVDGATVADVLGALDRAFPLVGRRVVDEQGAIRRHVHVYVGDERVRALDQPVPAGEEVTILPAVSGGTGP